MPLRRLLRIPIIIFCLWHMFALLVYTLPQTASDPITRGLRAVGFRLVTPYMLLTSQWQLWNLFSPDPLRRVVAYRIDAMDNGNWVPVVDLSPQHIREWRKADELKILRQLEENPPVMQPLRNRYIQAYCEPYHLAPGTPIRLVFRYYVIPYVDNASVSIHEPEPHEWIEEPSATTECLPATEHIVPVRFQ